MYRRLFAAFLLFGAMAFEAVADPPVWKVSHAGRYLYLAGTVHILSEVDYPLPPQFDKAYDDADVLAIEVDVDRLAQPRVQQRIFERSTYPEDMSLKDEISRDTLLELSRYCVQRNLSLQSMVRYRPGAVVSILNSVEFDRLALNGIGVDHHYLQRAKADKKPLRYLDSVQTNFQLSMDLNNENPDQVLRYALANVYNRASDLSSVKSAWREADMQSLQRLAVDPLKEKYPDVYYYLLTERNNDWIPKIEKMLRDEPVELVLFGAAHLVGDDGVLQLLRARGYRVETFY